MIRIPVTLHFNTARVIGFMEVDENSIPKTPDFVFALGYKTLDPESDASGRQFVLLDVGLVQDSEYAAFLLNNNGRPELDRAAAIAASLPENTNHA
jgi:hypothetical protein